MIGLRNLIPRHSPNKRIWLKFFWFLTLSMTVSLKVSNVCRPPTPPSRLPLTLVITSNLGAPTFQLTLGCYILSFPTTRVVVLSRKIFRISSNTSGSADSHCLLSFRRGDLQCYWWTMTTNPLANWKEFSKALETSFGLTEYEDYAESFAKIATNRQPKEVL